MFSCNPLSGTSKQPLCGALKNSELASHINSKFYNPHLPPLRVLGSHLPLHLAMVWLFFLISLLPRDPRAPLIGNPNGHFTKPGHFYPELFIPPRIESNV